MTRLQISVAQNDLEVGVEHEERLQQVLLVPKQQVMEHKAGWILVGQEYVVDMNQHAWLDRGMTSKNTKMDFASYLRYVRGVYEQHVARLQTLEELRAQLLNLSAE